MITERVYEKGSIIFSEGQFEMCFYNVLSGKVGIYSNYGKENEVLLTELEAGKYFGEMGVLEGMYRSATAVALEETKTQIIESQDMDEFFKNEPEKILELLENLTGRLRELSAQYLDTCHTIAEYVEAEEENKPKQSLLQKIKNIIKEADEYYAMYAEAASKDPFYYVNTYHGWY